MEQPSRKYLRTTEKIAEYAGLHISKEMRIVMITGKEEAITTPDKPSKKDIKNNPANMEVFKSELASSQQKKDKYEDDKAKLFVVILGQCSERVKHKLKSDDEFPTMHKEYNVVKLLKKLRVMIFSMGSVRHPCLSAHDALTRFLNIRQGAKESIEHYLIQFLALAEVALEIYGSVIPDKLLNSNKSNKDKISEKFQAMIFLNGADQNRYGKLLDDYNNMYLTSGDKYPETVDAAVTLMSHYRDGQIKKGPPKKDEEGIGISESSFAQLTKQKGILKKKGVKVVCYTCGNPGHIAPNCPMKDQVSDDGSVKSSSSKGSGGSQMLHWSGFEG